MQVLSKISELYRTYRRTKSGCHCALKIVFHPFSTAMCITQRNILKELITGWDFWGPHSFCY